jgi:SOS regulatory protein LexA
MEAAQRVQAIAQFYHRHTRMPSFRELQHLCGFKSSRAAVKLAAKLIDRGILAKDATGKLLPTRYFRDIRLLGVVAAGFPSPAEEELLDTMDLHEFLIRNQEATYMIKVEGRSMIGAGILPGDMVLVERGLEPRDGDIVIAEVDHQWTMKYFRKRGRRVYLEAANKEFKPIYPKEELKVAAVVIGVIRKYRDE